MNLLFENDACMVINKLPGESSEFPGVDKGGGIPAPVHRLDVPVSGCLLLAKTSGVAAFLGEAFAEGRVKKQYWAVMETPDEALPPEGELVHWLSFDHNSNKSFAHAQPGRNCKKALLRYRTAGKGERYLFLEIDLVTGRHHQIRAQLAAIGLHIKGDLKYGAKRSERGGGIRLHAYSLAFPDPVNSGEIIEVKALPPEMDALWTSFFEQQKITMEANDQ